MGLNLRPDSIRPQASYRSEPWYAAYMSALFESNAALMAQRIAVAERLIAARERELFQSRTGLPELRALNGALLALRALAICRKIMPASLQNDSGMPRVHETLDRLERHSGLAKPLQPERGRRG